MGIRITKIQTQVAGSVTSGELRVTRVLAKVAGDVSANVQVAQVNASVVGVPSATDKLQVTTFDVQVASDATEYRKYTSELGTNWSTMGLSSMVLGLSPTFGGEVIASIKEVSAFNDLAFTDQADNDDAITFTLTADDDLTFTQVADREVTLSLDAVASIAFTDIASGGQVLELTGTDSVAFTDLASRLIDFARTGLDSVAFTDVASIDNFTLGRDAADSLAFTDLASVVVEVAFQPSGEDDLTFTQSASLGASTFIRTRVNNVQITDQADVIKIIPGGTDLDANNDIAFTDVGGVYVVFADAIPLDGSGDLAFTQIAKQPVNLDASNTMVMEDVADVDYINVVRDYLAFTQEAKVNIVTDYTASDSLTFTHGGIPEHYRDGELYAGGCDITVTYFPLGAGDNPIGPEPVLEKQDDVVFFYPSASLGAATETMYLRTPNFGDRDRNFYNRINRESRGGSLNIYRDPKWPKIRKLVMDFSGVCDAEVDDIITFLEDTLGQEVGFRDWNNRTWTGLITSPDAIVVRTGSDRNDISIEMEVEE